MDLKEKTDNCLRHPWELSRTDNLIGILKKNIGNKKKIVIADIGAGDMYFDIRLVEKLKNENITPVVFAVDNAYNDGTKDFEEIFIYKDIAFLEDSSADCILMMDVLEHVENDRGFLKSALNKLKDDGIIVITVPAFQSLFSAHDFYLNHFRRYNYAGLKEIMEESGLKIIRENYFYFTLFIARWLQINMTPLKPKSRDFGVGTWKYGKGNVITKSIKLCLDIDFRANLFLNDHKINLPGLSLLAVAKKNKI